MLKGTFTRTSMFFVEVMMHTKVMAHFMSHKLHGIKTISLQHNLMHCAKETTIVLMQAQAIKTLKTSLNYLLPI